MQTTTTNANTPDTINLSNVVIQRPIIKQTEIVQSHETTKNAIPRIAYLQMTVKTFLSFIQVEKTSRLTLSDVDEDTSSTSSNNRVFSLNLSIIYLRKIHICYLNRSVLSSKTIQIVKEWLILFDKTNRMKQSDMIENRNIAQLIMD